MSIAISGASGQLGRRVAELLLDRVDPSELTLVSRSPDKLEDAATHGAQTRKGDFDDPAGLAEAFRGAERLLLISVDPVSKLRQHRNAIEAARSAGVQFVAYTSFVNPSEHNPAGIAGEHRETERMLRESGMEWAFLRNTAYAEMRVGDAQAALALGSLVHNTGDGRVAYVSRDDCAAAAATVVAGGDHHGEIYDVTGPKALGAGELASLYSELGGREVTPVAVDDGPLIEGMVQGGVPREIAELLASFEAAAREGHMDTVSSAVENLTGRAPRPLREILARQRDRLTGAAGSAAA
ncbi:MAG: SDR family oxidoreductase [Pseudonocardiaceae bacterium]